MIQFIIPTLQKKKKKKKQTFLFLLYLVATVGYKNKLQCKCQYDFSHEKMCYYKICTVQRCDSKVQKTFLKKQRKNNKNNKEKTNNIKDFKLASDQSLGSPFRVATALIFKGQFPEPLDHTPHVIHKNVATTLNDI